MRMFTDPVTYGYAVGRIRVLETRLVSKERIDRLIEAPDIQEQYRILADTDYSPFLEGMETYEDIEEGLEGYLAGVYGFLEEICPKSRIIDFFRLRYDFHNLRVLLKAKYLGEEVEYLWSKLGLFDVKQVQFAIKEDRLVDLPVALRKAVLEAEARFNKTKDPQFIDASLDRELYRELSQIAESLKNDFLLKLTKAFIDLTNLKAVLRAKNLEKSPDFVGQILIEGGVIAGKFLLFLYPQKWETVTSGLRNTPYGALLEQVISKGGADGALFDKLADDFVIGLAVKKKNVVAGLEPIVGYLLAKENEVKILRIVLVGKLAGLPSPAIEEKVREVYLESGRSRG